MKSTVHIAPRGSASEGSGRGTAASPFRFLFLDGRLKDPVTYILAPGKYLTRGAWAGVVNPSARVIAPGGASIVLIDPLLREGVRWTNILYFGNGKTTPSSMPPGLLQGVTLRVDESVAAGDVSYGGVYFWAPGEPRDCSAPARGSFTRQEEVFAFGSSFVVGPEPLFLRWQNLKASSVEGYASGISVGTHTGEPGHVLVDHFQVHAPRPAYAGVIPGSGVTFRDGRGTGLFRYGVAHDTEALDNCEVLDCQLNATYTSIHLVRTAKDWHQSGLRVRGGKYHVEAPSGQEAIFLTLLTQGGQDPATSRWTDISVDDADFTSNHLTPHLLSVSGTSPGIGAPRFSRALTTQNLKINGPIKPQTS